MPKIVNFGEFLKTWILRSNSVTRQVIFNRTKNGEKCQNWKSQMRHFEQISNTVLSHQLMYPKLKSSVSEKYKLYPWFQRCIESYSRMYLSFWGKSLAISMEFSSGNMEKKLADDVVDYSESSVEFSIWNRTWRSASRCIVSRGTFGDNSISNNIL